MVSVELNISKAEQDLINAVASLVAGVKAKKSIADLVASEVQSFITLAGEFSTLGSDFVASDKVDLGYYVAKQIEAAL